MVLSRIPGVRVKGDDMTGGRRVRTPFDASAAVNCGYSVGQKPPTVEHLLTSFPVQEIENPVRRPCGPFEPRRLGGSAVEQDEKHIP